MSYSGELPKKGTLIYDMYGNAIGRAYIGGYCSTINPDGVIDLEKMKIDDCDININVLRFMLVNGSYDYDGGTSDVKDRLYATGAEVGELPVPKKRGYKFLGWYTTDDVKLDSTTKITEDLEVKDKWEVMNYTFTLVYNDGTTQNTTIKVEHGSQITSLPTPTKSGYKFLGWYTSGGTLIYNGKYYYDAEDKTLYANYEKEGVNGVAVYYNPVTNAKCTEAEAKANTSKKAGCMKWYKFLDEDSTTAKVKLILDHNTTYSVNWAPTGTSTATSANTQLATDVSTWNSAVKSTARLITIAEITSITKHTSWNNEEYYLTGGDYVHALEGTNPYGWLFDKTSSCTSYGCKESNYSTYGYWTGDEQNSSLAWYIYSNGSLKFDSKINNYNAGIRPVIEVARTTIS